MKKVPLLFAIMFAIFSATFAQTSPATTMTPQDKGSMPADKMTKGENGRHRGESMMKKLGLTADQSAKMKAAHSDFKAKSEAIRSNTSISKENRKTQMHALQATREQIIHDILTPEQYTQYQKMIADGKENMKEKRMEKKAAKKSSDN